MKVRSLLISLLILIKDGMDIKKLIKRKEMKNHLFNSPRNPEIVVKIEIIISPIDVENTILSRMLVSKYKILRNKLPSPIQEIVIIIKNKISGRISTI